MDTDMKTSLQSFKGSVAFYESIAAIPLWLHRTLLTLHCHKKHNFAIAMFPLRYLYRNQV